ncbi:unnamed protein product [Cuscuta campestris]|uniref:CRAL-TRIO domain-containing protein n=2 Tax=Cuscuta sect. Cleistogrammica TaxID=1824901 RepID=A0A484M899_9ASTE|nr:hypothetical protein DM860_007550 [Cuscuta australis]VFQ84815.1 unnamed protein product [Cuscuta campestris]
MCLVSQESINEFGKLMEKVDEPLKRTFQNIHQGNPHETLERFLSAREGNVSKAHQMLLDSLKWRVQNEIDDILAKPIIPADLYRDVRDSHLVGLSGYTREGLPVFAFGVGLSTFDKASDNYYVQSHIQMNEYRDRVVLPSASKKHGTQISKCIKVLDMSGLKLSALSQIKLGTLITSIDDLNYPERTITYYIVNAPYVFSACWKVVRPLLHERTRKKVRVLSGSGQDELLKIMEYSSLPHFCRRKGSGSSRYTEGAGDNCFSLDHPFHQQHYNYMKKQSLLLEPLGPRKQGSFHVDFPETETEGTQFVKTMASELQKLGNKKDGISDSFEDLN